MVKIGDENNPLRNYISYLYLFKFPVIFRIQFLIGRHTSGGALEGVVLQPLEGRPLGTIDFLGLLKQ